MRCRIRGTELLHGEVGKERCPRCSVLPSSSTFSSAFITYEALALLKLPHDPRLWDQTFWLCRVQRTTCN